MQTTVLVMIYRRMLCLLKISSASVESLSLICLSLCQI